MQPTRKRNRVFGVFFTVAVSTTSGIALGIVSTRSMATTAIPTEHKGLQVLSAGAISSASMEAQIGLSGYKLQLREITIEPGGQIARHSHETRPGVVRIISGTWTEGRPDGEIEYSGSGDTGILEDEETVHWFWNRGNEAATAMVCDIVPDN